MWTTRMIKRFLQLTSDKKIPYTVVASTLSHEFKKTVTKNAAIGKAKRLGLPPRECHHYGRPRHMRGNKIVLRTPAPDARKRRRKTPAGITIMQLKPRHCRFIISEDKPYLFCSETKLEHSSYCAEHHAVTHTGYWKR